MAWVWVPDYPKQCECHAHFLDYFWVHKNCKVERRSENTGYGMIYWEDCTCKKCGREFEYNE